MSKTELKDVYECPACNNVQNKEEKNNEPRPV